MKKSRSGQCGTERDLVALVACLALAVAAQEDSMPSSVPSAHPGRKAATQAANTSRGAMPSMAVTGAPSSSVSNAPPAMPGMAMPGAGRPAGEGVPGRTAVELDQPQRQLIDIRTTPVLRGEAVVTIRTVGIVAYDQALVANVNTRIMGWAEKLYVDKPGQLVKAGEPLLDLYSPNLYSAQYEYLLAYRRWQRLKQSAAEAAPAAKTALQDSLQEAQSLLESARRRLQLWAIPPADIAALEKSGRPSDTLQLHAPATGNVIEKNIDPGQIVQPGTTLYLLADLRRVWINAAIYEYELPYAKAGQKVRITALAHPGRTFEATVDFIYPYSQNKTRTTLIRLVMDNPQLLFRPNDYVNAEIRVDQGPHLLIPHQAVYNNGINEYVFVEAKEGYFVPQRIELGPTVQDDRAVVYRGLAEGQRVVVEGNFMLDSESQLRASSSGGMAGMPGMKQ